MLSWQFGCKDASSGAYRVSDFTHLDSEQTERFLHLQGREQQGEAGVPGEVPGFGESGSEPLISRTQNFFSASSSSACPHGWMNVAVSNQSADETNTPGRELHQSRPRGLGSGPAGPAAAAAAAAYVAAGLQSPCSCWSF